MSSNHSDQQDNRMDQLLAGAAKVVAEAPWCWLVTNAQSGGVAARPMGRISPPLQRNDWVVSFITDGQSRKAHDIRRAPEVTLVVQRDADDAFVTLSGLADLHEDEAEVSRRWKSAFDRYFRTDAERARATFVDIRIAKMELWIRGVTPEPFGLRATTLTRDKQGVWRIGDNER